MVAMAQVTEPEIDSIREAQADFMPGVGSVQRNKPQGDGEYARQLLYDDVPYRLIPGFGRWADIADRFVGITAFRLTVPHDYTLHAGDVFIDEAGSTYEIRDVLSHSSYQTAVQALVDLVNDG